MADAGASGAAQVGVPLAGLRSTSRWEASKAPRRVILRGAWCFTAAACRCCACAPTR